MAIHKLYLVAIAIAAMIVGTIADGESSETPDDGKYAELASYIDNHDFAGEAQFPGTKWCGDKRTATDFDDLGTETETDICCRTIYHCPDKIESMQTENDLYNSAPYARYSCECSDTFRQCLHDVGNDVAKQVGLIYFNVLDTVCFKNDYPITGCKAHGGVLERKCIEYELDTEAEKKYQWFDVNIFN